MSSDSKKKKVKEVGSFVIQFPTPDDKCGNSSINSNTSNAKSSKSSDLDGDKSNSSFKTQKSIGKDSFNELTKEVEEESNNVLITPTTKKDSNAHCRFCGNCYDDCHNQLFGEFLVQEAITLYEKAVDQDSITEDDICFLFKEKYNTHLRFLCHHDHDQYDTKSWYELPVCIESGSLLSAIHVIGQQQQYMLYSKKRKYGAIRKNMGGC